jgi:hypothetical protein
LLILPLRHDAVGVEHQFDELLGHGSFCLPIRLEATRLAGHTGNVEARAARPKRVVRLAEAARPEPDEVVEHRLAQELDGVARQEERDLVAFGQRRIADQKPERRLAERPPANVDSAWSSLLSKLRRVVELEGPGDVRLLRPGDAWVDRVLG